MNIVLVDDEQVILDGLGKMISQLDDGWQVCAAFTDAEEALNSCDWDQVQVLLVDITMPGMSGLALVEALRENAFDTLVIFVTAHADFSYAQRGAHLQMFDYLLKPISTDELQKVLRRAEKTSRKNLQARESQEYIRRNLHVLRKHFLGDYMFEERMISGEELTQRKKDYALENMSYAIALLQSVLPRNIVKEKLSTVLTAHQWMLYGQENSYELLLLCQQPLELSILPRCIPAPEGRWRIAPEWLRLEQLPDAFQKLLMLKWKTFLCRMRNCLLLYVWPFSTFGSITASRFHWARLPKQFICIRPIFPIFLRNKPAMRSWIISICSAFSVPKIF